LRQLLGGRVQPTNPAWGRCATATGPRYGEEELGRAGYPLVDAGMRQLTGQGWARNRARAGIRRGTDYPHPIVDHRHARDRALSRFQEATGATVNRREAPRRRGRRR
jgi:hypothetical protein